MRVVAFGTVAAVTPRSYNDRNGQPRHVVDVHVGEAPYFDKITMPLELQPQLGDRVQYLVKIKAKTVNRRSDGQPATFIDAWAIERLADMPAEDTKLKAVNS